MKVSGGRYGACLLLQIIFLVVDLVFNCITLFPRTRDTFLILFIFQDLFLVLSITAMMITFSSTYLFQAGLVELLFRKFRPLLLVSTGYLAACLVLHACWLADKWDSHHGVSTPGLVCLFTVQRCLSPCFYFFYKKAALRISDPRFYEDIDWINTHLQTE